MRIPRKWIFIVPAVLITGPIWFQLATKPTRIFADRIIFGIALGVLLLSLVAAFISLLIVTIVQKKHWENRIYFFGQLSVPVLAIGVYFFIYFKQKNYQATQANIDANQDFIRWAYYQGPDTLGYRALEQLESTFENRNDLKLFDTDIERVDTIIKGNHDLVMVLHLGYTDIHRPDEKKYSKHVFGLYTDTMVFYNVPESELPHLRIKDEEAAREAGQVLKEAAEELKKINWDSIHAK